MIDLHSHLLPAVDDGSESVEQSWEVCGRMASRGVTDICLTPHLAVAELGERLSSRLAAHDKAFSSLSAHARAAPHLHRGVELMLNERLSDEALVNRRISLAGSRYILVEFPRTLSALAMRGLLNEITGRGFVPVVAHPERYAEASTAEVFAWRDLGAAIQVDATTIIENKSARGVRARELLQAGLADILAADNHGDDRMLPTAYAYLDQVGAPDAAELLLRHNPLAILEDRALEPVPPIQFRRSWATAVRRLFSQVTPF